MRTMIKTTSLLLLGWTTIIPLANAQDKFEVSGNVELVSSYVWRGMDQESGASLQPSLTLGYKGFSLEAWGSGSLSDFHPQEFDITLGIFHRRFRNIGNRLLVGRCRRTLRTLQRLPLF